MSEVTESLSPEQALERLIAGNRRFQKASVKSQAREWSGDQALVPQRPFAIVLGCSDSRNPVEIIFDEGFGELFVVRIAGNIVSPSVIGSIEFAASQFGTRLVVIMGHTRCGAVGATVKVLQTGETPESKNIQAITDRIGPHIEDMVRPGDSEGIVREAVRAHVRASAHHLRHGSAIIEEMIATGRVAVVGAEYELETGEVHFFDGVPLPGQRSAKKKI